MKRSFAISMLAGSALFLGLISSPAFAQRTEAVFNGHRIIIPQSSQSISGRHHTNYFFVDSDQAAPQPPPGNETPASLACVYQLVTGPTGCPIPTSTNVPTGGVGAIAIVDAGYYPTAASDLAAFSSQFGIPQADFTQVWPGKKQPEVEPDWEVEEALDIEWAHSMAPQAKLYLVVSKLCNVGTCATDPFWDAVTLAAKLVKEAGGGVVSMSWGDPEWSTESAEDKLFNKKDVVFFAASGDSGIGVSIYPGSSPNVVSVGGTYFNRNGNGDFESEVYGGGGGDLSPYEPRPSYQSGIESIVGTQRGYPDVASDFCCAVIYLEGGWYSVGGTSWASPTFAGIVNAAGSLEKSTVDELTMMYDELANPTEYKADFNDITQGNSQCKTGWDLCAGIGSARTYAGK
ncbi:MAG TPA: S53 family peptidase [Terriglobales bacterium]|jgi:kumamolisin|nr:S53 family peptidase [Terriglobales bacterium]